MMPNMKKNHQKLEDAKADIIQAKADLADVDVPEWYVLDRNYITTCVAYAQDSERIGKYWKCFSGYIFFPLGSTRQSDNDDENGGRRTCSDRYTESVGI